MLKKIISNKIVNNAGWIIGCKLCKAVLVMVTTMLISRHLGVSDYGLLSYAAGLVFFVGPIMKLGIDNVLVKEIVSNPESDGEIMGTTMVLNLCSAILCIIGIAVFTFFVNGDEPKTIFVCFIYSLMLLFQATEMIYYWSHAKMLAKYSAIAMLVAYIVVTVVQGIMVLMNASVYAFALSHSIDFFIITVILFVLYKKKGGGKLSFSFKRGRNLFYISKLYIISGLMVTVFSQTDRIMLKLMAGNEATGIYTAATSCATMTAFIFIAIVDSMRPGIFEGRKEGGELFEKRLKQLYTIVIYFSLLQSLFSTIFAPIIIYVMYGQAFFDSIRVLQISVWFTTFSYLGTVRDIWILAEGKQKYLPIINTTGALANVILNFVLIPLWGACGAAVASLVTQFFTNVIVGYIIPAIRPHNKLMMQSLNLKKTFSSMRQLVAKEQ